MHNMLNCQGIAQAACLVKEDSKLIFKDTIKLFTSLHVTAESSVLACSHSLLESIPSTIYKIMLFPCRKNTATSSINGQGKQR